MDYSFNCDIAGKWGVDGAVFIQNVYFWIIKNEANGRHFYDEKTWTYNSASALSRLFPFWSKSQIKRLIKRLEEGGAIYVGNYNERTFDKTGWYALTEEVLDIYRGTKSSHDGTESSHGRDGIVPPIPDSKPDSKPDIHICEVDIENVVASFNRICKSLPKVRDITEPRKKAIQSASKRLTDGFEDFFSLVESSDFLTGRANKNGEAWTASFDWILKPANMTKILEGNYGGSISKDEDSFFQRGLKRRKAAESERK